MIKTKINKKLLSLFTAITVVGTSMIFVTAADKPSIEVTNLNVSNTEVGWGQVEVIGYIKNATKLTAGDNQISLLLTDIDNNEIVSENIAYIDQIATGNNASFKFSFSLGDKFTEVGTELYLKINSTEDTELYKTKITVPIGNNCNIYNLANNTVWYGKDAYSLDSVNLTATNVANSIIAHGNKIYYKYNYKWYDLLDEDATSSNFFLDETNACSDSQVEQQICTGCSKDDGSKYYYGQYVSNILPIQN